MAETQFSLLLPVYKNDDPAHFKLALVSSTAEQTRKPAEVVIVQDGPIETELAEAIESADELAGIPVKHVLLKENHGLAVALQYGLQETNYDVVARIDADDVSLPERFTKQLPYIEDGYDVVGSAITEFDFDHEVAGRTRVLPTGEDIVPYSRLRCPVYHPSVVFKKSVILDAGGYQPFGAMEDYWLWARVLMCGGKLENLRESLVMYRIGAGAFKRRGGFAQLCTDMRLQFALRKIGFISRTQLLRNTCIRLPYRILPSGIKKTLSKFVNR